MIISSIVPVIYVDIESKIIFNLIFFNHFFHIDDDEEEEDLYIMKKRRGRPKKELADITITSPQESA